MLIKFKKGPKNEISEWDRDFLFNAWSKFSENTEIRIGDSESYSNNPQKTYFVRVPLFRTIFGFWNYKIRGWNRRIPKILGFKVFWTSGFVFSRFWIFDSRMLENLITLKTFELWIFEKIRRRNFVFGTFFVLCW